MTKTEYTPLHDYVLLEFEDPKEDSSGFDIPDNAKNKNKAVVSKIGPHVATNMEAGQTVLFINPLWQTDKQVLVKYDNIVCLVEETESEETEELE